MFDWFLNTCMQPDTSVNMWKGNTGSIQSTRCNEVWNRIKDEVSKAGLKGIIGIVWICYNAKTKLETQKKLTKEPKKKKTDRKLTCFSNIYWIEEVLGYRDVMEISKLEIMEISNKLELLMEKLKQTATMNRLRLIKKEKTEKWEKTWR